MRFKTAIPLFPFPVTCLDSDNGVESGNDELIDWLQMKDIEQTRSRPYRKNDQATVESRNNHVVRKFAFHWRYDAPEQLDLLSRLWEKTYLLLNLFTPTRKPIRVEQGRDGRRKTVYDQPRTPWARVLCFDAPIHCQVFGCVVLGWLLSVSIGWPVARVREGRVRRVRSR